MVKEYVFEFARAAQADDPYAFSIQPQSYLLRSAGGGFQTAEFSWDPALLADLATVRLPGCDPAVIQQVAERLRRFLDPLGFAEQEPRILAASRAGHEVVLTFRSAAAELYALPWELMAIKSTGQLLGGLPNVLLRYEWPETTTIAESPSPRREGGRVLLAWSAAGGAVPASEHSAALRTACNAGAWPFHPDTDILANASGQGLVAKLAAARTAGDPIVVLHLLCHGGEAGSSFGLVLDGEQPGDGKVVMDAGRLRQLLAPFADQVRLIVLSACDSANGGAMGNHLGSVAQALHRVGFAQVIASRYPLTVAASQSLTETLYRELLVNTRSVEQALYAARQRLAQESATLDWASIQLYARAADGQDSRPLVFRPFRGLLAFQPQHSRFFFGRQSEIGEIVSALGALTQAGRPRFLIVAGASGSGKSSLVLAGAVPRLVEQPGEPLRLLIMQPGGQPQRLLDAVLKEAAGRPALLVVDQFEEVFTHVTDKAAQQEFVQRLWHLASDADGKLRIIATLRVDFLGECGGIVVDGTGRRLDNIAYAQAHRVFVAQMGPSALRAAIEGPVQRIGVDLEAGLLSRMLDAVGAEPGALPLLEYTLDVLWLRRQGRALTQAGYDAVGQVAGALGQHSDALLANMSEADQEIARRLLVRLVHVGEGPSGGTRERVPIERLRPKAAAAAAQFDRVLGELVDARLLFRSGEARKQTIEVAHEALIRRWQRLAEWLQKDRVMLARLQELEALVAQCSQYKVLLTGQQLTAAEEFERDYKEECPEAARQLLLDSQRSARRRRFFSRLPTVLAPPLALLFGLLFWQARADKKEREAALSDFSQLATTISHQPSTTELLQLLARLQMELGEQPELALSTLDRAQEREPQSPVLTADRSEYLVAATRFSEVQAVAEPAFSSATDAQSRLRLALAGWSAARFNDDRAAQLSWAPRVEAEYKKWPTGPSFVGFVGLGKRLLKPDHPLHTALPLRPVLEVYRLVRKSRTAETEYALAKLLRSGL